MSAEERATFQNLKSSKEPLSFPLPTAAADADGGVKSAPIRPIMSLEFNSFIVPE